MKRFLSAAAVLSVLAAIGCSPALTQPQTASRAANEPATPAADTQDVKADTDVAADDGEADAKGDAAVTSAAAETTAADPTSAPWAAGDFVVYRFSGSFHKTPVTLTEKVVARQGDSFTLDVTYDDGKTKEAIRARMKGTSPASAEVVSVARLVRGVEQPASAALFEEIFARVALVADQNEAQLGTESVKVDVAGHGAVACERATYRVKVGKDTATMRTLGSPAFVWGDVGAEITAASGKLIYKAEVVEAGHESAKAPAIASAEDDY